MDRLRGANRYGWTVFMIVVLLSGVVSGVIGVSILRNKHQASRAQQAAEQAQTALRALCFQRHDLDVRIAQTAGFLIHHQQSKRIFGIPRAVLVRSLDQSIQFRANLNILDCKEK